MSRVRERIVGLLESYSDALDSLAPTDFETPEAYHASRNIWQEVTSDLNRLLL